jgi:glycosyltransferase involved in cell wall biosynthesis
VSNSAFTSGELLAHGVTRSKCRTILNAAPGRDAAPVPAGVRPDPQRIIYVGQVIPPKGLHVLLEAVAELRRRGVTASLDVVGAMDTWEPATFEGYRARVRERTAAPDLAGHVRFLGHREDVPALLASAAVHCCPSLPEVREGFGLVVVEAKEAGRPSVVFSTGALPELVTHRLDGWVCEQATAKALADGLQYFLADADACRAAGEMARRSAVRFTRDRFVGEWLQVFGVEQPSAVPAAPSLIAPEEQGHAC